MIVGSYFNLLGNSNNLQHLVIVKNITFIKRCIFENYLMLLILRLCVFMIMRCYHFYPFRYILIEYQHLIFNYQPLFFLILGTHLWIIFFKRISAFIAFV